MVAVAGRSCCYAAFSGDAASRREVRNRRELGEEGTPASGQAGQRRSGGFPCLPLAGSQHLLAQEAATPAPQSSHCPRGGGRTRFPPREPRKILKPVASTRCSPSSACYGACALPPPTSIPTGTREPTPVPTTALPVLRGHIHTVSGLGVDSALLRVLQSHSQIHNPVGWQRENGKALPPPPGVPDAPAQAGQAASRAGATPRPCEAAGGLSGTEVPLRSGSRRPGVGDALAGGIGLRSRQPVQAEPLSEPHVTARSSSGPTRCSQKPRSPALRWRQEVEDSSDEFFKFILVDDVACTFDVLDIGLGEEALDLRVVFGAAGQANTPRAARSAAQPAAFPPPPQAEGHARADHIPFPTGKARCWPQVPPRSPARWASLAAGGMELAPGPSPSQGASSHPGKLQKSRLQTASLQSHLI